MAGSFWLSNQFLSEFDWKEKSIFLPTDDDGKMEEIVADAGMIHKMMTDPCDCSIKRMPGLDSKMFH